MYIFKMIYNTLARLKHDLKHDHVLLLHGAYTTRRVRFHRVERQVARRAVAAERTT